MTQFTEGFMALARVVSLLDIVDILVVAYLIYQAIKLVRETRAIQLVKGILALLAIYIVSYYAHLRTMTFIMRNILQIGALALLVVFQPELRRALERMGRSKISNLNVFGNAAMDDQKQQFLWRKTIANICDSCASMSRQRIGALMVLERETPLGDVIKTGTIIDADSSIELLINIFFPNSPLHDGALIIRGGKLYAAGCFLPLSANFEISKELGTRHRAALGISENSDALVIVVSEENGKITIAEGGKFKRGVSIEELGNELRSAFIADHNGDAAGRRPAFWKGKKA